MCGSPLPEPSDVTDGAGDAAQIHVETHGQTRGTERNEGHGAACVHRLVVLHRDSPRFSADSSADSWSVPFDRCSLYRTRFVNSGALQAHCNLVPTVRFTGGVRDGT